MKNKNKAWVAVAILALAISIITIVISFARGKDEPTINPTGVPEATPSAGPTDTPVPTLTNMPETTKVPEPTGMPTPMPTDMPTVTPEATPAPEPSPTPTSTPLPSPTPTPEATLAPTEVPVITPTPAPEATIKIGEYEIPATYTYNGKEYLWFDESDGTLIQAEKVGSNTYLIAYSDKNLKNYIMIFDVVTEESCTYYVSGLDLKTATIPDMLGYIIETNAKSHTSVGDPFRGMEVMSSLLPTPTPTPTPYPTPNPEKPKMIASYQGDKEYGDITVEAWDNGYLYVKGTGVLRKNFSMSYTPQDLKDYWAFDRGVKVTHVIVEEGVTELRDFPYWASNSYDKRESVIYLEFPSTLTGVSVQSFDIHFLNDVEIVGYKDGEKITYLLETDGKKLSDKESLYDVMRKNFNIHSVGYSD